MRVLPIIVVTMISICLIVPPAQGSVCTFASTGTYFSARSELDVYYYYNPNDPIDQYTGYRTQSGTGLNSPMDSMGLSETTVQHVISRAIEIWNEEGGTSLRLVFKGATTAQAIGCATVNGVNTCGLILYGRTNLSNHTRVCDSSVAQSYVNTSGGNYSTGTVEFRQYTTTYGCSTSFPWSIAWFKPNHAALQ
jgi:hypothetical protein